MNYPSARDILELVEEKFGIPHADLVGTNEFPRAKRARAIAALLIEQLVGGMPEEVGGHIGGRSRTEVCNLYNEANRLLAKDSQTIRWATQVRNEVVRRMHELNLEKRRLESEAHQPHPQHSVRRPN